MIHDSVLGCVGSTPIVRLRRLFTDPGVDVLAKLELLNPGGSVKDRPARLIVERGLADGTIRPGGHLVESSSGNFGIALAMAGLVHRLSVTVVVDPNTTASNLLLLRRFGARVETVDTPDVNGGYLHERLRRVHEILAVEPGALWVNQYANTLGYDAHAATAVEILAEVPDRIDVLVAGVSTGGTIHGVARVLRRRHPGLRVVAVDAVGSVLFGGAPGRRRIPGIGASRVPELLRPAEVDEVVRVSDEQAVEGCRDLLAAEGILAGGSSGAVMWALRDLSARLPRRTEVVRIVTILPDRGERYLDVVYDDPAPVPAASGRHR